MGPHACTACCTCWHAYLARLRVHAATQHVAAHVAHALQGSQGGPVALTRVGWQPRPSLQAGQQQPLLVPPAQPHVVA